MFESTLAWLESQYTPGKMIMVFAFMFIVGLGSRTAKHLGSMGATYKNSGVMLLLAYLIFRFVPGQWDMSLLFVALSVLIFVFRWRKKE